MTPEEIVKRDLEKATRWHFQKSLERSKVAQAEIERIVLRYPYLKEYPIGDIDGVIFIELPECTKIRVKANISTVTFVTEQGEYERIEDAVYSANQVFMLVSSKGVK